MSELISCLRCRLCRLEPDTNMSHPMPVIFCNFKAERSCLILSGCGLANPEYKSKGGDKERYTTPVEIEWLRVHYANAPVSQLRHVTGRKLPIISHIARVNNLPMRTREAFRRTQSQGQTKYTQAQRDYIVNAYKSGFWTRSGGRSTIPQENAVIHEKILADVALLGPPMKWTSVQFVAYSLCSRGYVQRQKKRAAQASGRWGRPRKIKEMA